MKNWIPALFILIIGLTTLVGCQKITPKPEPISNQLSIFQPIHVILPGNWIPEFVVPGESADQFVLYAYSVNVYNKSLLLIDNQGNVLYQTGINTSCQFPFIIKKVGLVMDYCKPNSQTVYKIEKNKIVFIEDGAFIYNENDRIDIRKISDLLSDSISYQFKCGSECWPDGGCCDMKTSLSIEGKQLNINGYSLRDFIKLDNGTVAIIFGTYDPSSSNDNKDLFIFKGK